MSSRTIAGTPSRKTEPHQKCSSSTPPTIGPTIAPTVKQPAQMPIASERWRLSVNRLLISASVDGASVAPAIPSSARAAMSMSAVVENAASTEASPNAVAPMSSGFRRPMRSPRVPMVTMNPAIMKP